MVQDIITEKALNISLADSESFQINNGFYIQKV